MGFAAVVTIWLKNFGISNLVCIFLEYSKLSLGPWPFYHCNKTVFLHMSGFLSVSHITLNILYNADLSDWPHLVRKSYFQPAFFFRIFNDSLNISWENWMSSLTSSIILILCIIYLKSKSSSTFNLFIQFCAIIHAVIKAFNFLKLKIFQFLVTFRLLSYFYLAKLNVFDFVQFFINFMYHQTYYHIAN